MIIDQVQDTTTEVIGGENIAEQEFALDSESLGIFFKVFSDSTYSDKIGSIVREIVSNGVDSHIEAKVDKPVLVSLFPSDPSSDLPARFVVEDFGVGMSRERVAKIYAKYFSSTKRETNGQIGGFGIGAKSPLAYVDAFNVRTRFAGTEYIYTVHRGEKAPSIKLMDSYETEKGNGTQVSISLKSVKDEDLFKIAIKNQLRYFEELYYQGFITADNDFQIIKGKTFLYNPSNTPEKLEIALGRVRYPISESHIKELLTKRISERFAKITNVDKVLYTPVALRFEVGQLPVTMSRESLEYKDDVAEKIVNKIVDMLLELFEITRNKLRFDDLKEYLQGRSLDYIPLTEDVNLWVPFKIKNHVVFTPFEAFEKENQMKFDIPLNPFFEYEVKRKLARGKVLKVASESESYKKDEADGREPKHEFQVGAYLWGFSSQYKNRYWDKDTVCLRVQEEKVSKRKALYLNEKYGNNIYLIRPRNYNQNVFAKIAAGEAMKIPQETQDKAVIFYREYISNYLLHNVDSYEEHQVPDEWIKQYESDLKEERERKRGNEKITFRLLQPSTCYDFYWYTDNHKVADIFEASEKLLFVVGTMDDTNRLENLALSLKSLKKFEGMSFTGYNRFSKRVAFARVSQANLKYFRDNPRFLSPNQAMKVFAKDIARSYFIVAFPDFNKQYEAIRHLVKDSRLEKLYGVYRSFYKEHRVKKDLPYIPFRNWGPYASLHADIIHTVDGVNYDMFSVHRLIYRFLQDNLWITGVRETSRSLITRLMVDDSNPEKYFNSYLKSLLNFKSLYGKTYCNAQW